MASFTRSLILIFVTILLIGCLLVSLCAGGWIVLAAAGAPSGIKSYETIYGEDNADKQFLSLSIAGPILTNRETEGSGFGLFGEPLATYGYQVKEQLYQASEDEKIAGIILEINSPGGTITGAKAISDGIAYYKEQTKKPVVAHISGLGASGGYWVAASADYIMLDAGSLTGSIGVIYGPFKFYNGVVEEGSILGKVVTQNGIETTYFTAGQYKDNGSPYRRLTQEEVNLIQQGINNEYAQFVKFVAGQRQVSEEEVRTKVKALAYDNKTAIELKLADREGSREDAYAELAKRAQAGDSYKVVQEQGELSFLGSLFGAKSEPVSKTELAQTCVLCDKPLYFHGNPEVVVKY